MAKQKLEVGMTFVLNETTDEVLARKQRHTWSRNGLMPRTKLKKLKLTKEQQKTLQTPSYLR